MDFQKFSKVSTFQKKIFKVLIIPKIPKIPKIHSQNFLEKFYLNLSIPSEKPL